MPSRVGDGPKPATGAGPSLTLLASVLLPSPLCYVPMSHQSLWVGNPHSQAVSGSGKNEVWQRVTETKGTSPEQDSGVTSRFVCIKYQGGLRTRSKGSTGPGLLPTTTLTWHRVAARALSQAAGVVVLCLLSVATKHTNPTDHLKEKKN